MSELLNKVAANTAIKYGGLSGDKEAALDPATIMVFAELILKVMELFKNCKATPKSAAETMKKPGLFARMRLRSVVKDSMSREEFRDRGTSVINALMASGEDANQDTVTALYNEV
jgi:hypothetical protein